MKTIIGEKTRLFDKDFMFESKEDAQKVLKKERRKEKVIIIAAIAYVIALFSGWLILDVINPTDSIFTDMFAFGAFGVMLMYAILMIPYNLKFAGKVYRIISSHFIFITGKLLFGATTALYLFIMGSASPLYSAPVSLWQSHLIKKAATENIDSDTSNTVSSDTSTKVFVTKETI